MSRARLIVAAVVVEGRSQAAVARDYGVSKAWVSTLVGRWRAGGDEAVEPRSRRPNSNPTATPPETVALIVELRHQLSAAGLDAGADTIRWHLAQHHRITISRATVYRILRRSGTITPAPKKRPKSSYIRFQADLPNETWQADFTHHRLADTTDTEILCWIDDHSRYAISVTAHRRVTGPIVVTAFTHRDRNPRDPRLNLDRQRDGVHHPPVRRQGRTQRLRTPPRQPRRRPEELATQPPHHLRESRALPRDPQEVAPPPAHRHHDQPTTAPTRHVPRDLQPSPPTPLTPTRRDPHTIYTTRPKATPTGIHSAHSRVRHDRVAQGGKVTLRIAGQLHHIGIGRPHTGTPILMLIDDLDVRIIHATTGEIIRTLTIDPQPPLPRHRQTTRRPTTILRTTKPNDQTLNEGSVVHDVSRHHMRADDGNRTRIISLEG